MVDPELLRSMRDTMRHRGPDDAGIWTSKDGTVGLAHRRLAIIDTSAGGHQPMLNQAGDLCITYNGEIYNYQELRRELEAKGANFRTSSDTEVILEAYRAWGTDCLAHFNGVFAFGIYDHVARRLFLARDRPGEKPLFYWHTAGGLVFASELKALMANPVFPRTLNLEALDSYLAYGYVPGTMCMLEGVHKLPQAHAMTYDLDEDRLNVWRYWDLPEPSIQRDVSEVELLDELDSLLEDSVRLRLIADVPVGILLSGGVDSSLVTAMASRVSSHPIKTFTLSFAGYEAFDEAPFARIVANHFGTDHLEIVAEPTVVDVLPELAKQYDEPMADASMVPTFLISRLVRQHATVALSGDGGDEVFGGYPHYNLLLWQERLRGVIPQSLRRWMSRVAAHRLPAGFRGRNHIIGFGADLPNSIAHVNLFFDSVTRQRLLVPEVKHAGFEPEAYKADLCERDLTPLQQAMRVDFRTTLVDAYLVKADRASMLASLEMRAPFLDHRIVEFTHRSVPDSLRVTLFERRILSRLLGKRLLPPTLDLKRKQGFTMPMATWFKGEWGHFIEGVLSDIDPTLFDRSAVRSLIEGQRKGLANADRLFALTIFELWRREYGVTLAG